MPSPNLTHKDIAVELGIAEATVKSYRRAFPEFFDLRHTGKPLRYAPSALEVCRIIRDGRRDALSEADIRERIEQNVPEAKALSSANRPSEPSFSRPEAGAQSAVDAGVIARIEEALAQVAETQRQLVQIQGESAARLGAMQHRMFEALTVLQERSERQDAIVEALTQRQHAILDMLESLSGQCAEVMRARSEPEGRVGQSEPVERPASDRSGHRVTHVAVRNAYGDVQRYTLSTGEHAGPPEPATTSEKEPPHQEPAERSAPEPAEAVASPETLPEGPAPPRDYLELPLVVRSEMGEYLGVAGKALGSFSLGDLYDLVQESFPPPRTFRIRYEPADDVAGGHLGGVWILFLDQESGQSYRLSLERTTTPRGNDVVVLAALEVDGQDVPPANLYLFIKQMLQLRTQS